MPHEALNRCGFLARFAFFVLFTGFGSDAWRNSTARYGFGVIVVTTAASTMILVHLRGSISVESIAMSGAR